MAKVQNYSDAQVALIKARAAANGGVLSLADAEALAAMPEMNSEDGPRKARSITAKISRMVAAKETLEDGTPITYARKEPTTKDGKPVNKKVDLVRQIAKDADVAFESLNGLEKAPKLALETLAASFAS